MGAEGAKHPIPIAYILTTWHGMVNPVALSLCLFRLRLSHYLHQPLSAEDDDGKIDSYVKRERDLNITYPISAMLNSTNTTLVAWPSSAAG
jgi:hypothetical protein